MQLAKLNWIRYNFYIILISGYFGIVLLGYVYFGVLLQSTLGIVSVSSSSNHSIVRADEGISS